MLKVAQDSYDTRLKDLQAELEEQIVDLLVDTRSVVKRAILQSTANDSCAVINLADDEHRTDDPRGQALQHDRLVVVHWYLRAVR